MFKFNHVTCTTMCRLRVSLLLLAFLCFASPNAVLQQGRLLAITLDYSADVSLFSIEANGIVTKLWNATLVNAPHADDALYSDCAFAFAPTTQSIYISSIRYQEAIDVHTGKIRQTQNNPNANFVSMYYNPTNRTLYGVCAGSDSEDGFGWCEWQINSNSTRNSTVKFFYNLNELIIGLGPVDCLSDYVAEESLYFYASDKVYGVNTTNGDVVYTALVNESRSVCFKYDSIGRVLYGIGPLDDLGTRYGLFKLFGDGKTRPKKLLDFPAGWGMEGIGTCEIAREDRTLFALMRNATFSDKGTSFPEILFSVDLVTMSVENYSVAAFAKNMVPYQAVSRIKYVPNSLWIEP